MQRAICTFKINCRCYPISVEGNYVSVEKILKCVYACMKLLGTLRSLYRWGLRKAPRGFVHTYIHTYAHIGLFPYRYRGLLHEAPRSFEGLWKALKQRVYMKPLMTLYTHTCTQMHILSFFLQVRGYLVKGLFLLGIVWNVKIWKEMSCLPTPSQRGAMGC